MVAFCGGILAPGRWSLSWYKCPGVPRGQTPGMAADKCIIRHISPLTIALPKNREVYTPETSCMKGNSVHIRNM